VKFRVYSDGTCEEKLQFDFYICTTYSCSHLYCAHLFACLFSVQLLMWSVDYYLCSFILFVFSSINRLVRYLLFVFICICVHLFVCFQFSYLCDQLLIIVFICGHLFCLFSVTYYLYVLFIYSSLWLHLS
jgi:hypothetical protein